MRWPLPPDRTLPLLLVLQCLTLRAVRTAYYPNFGVVGCYRYKNNMENFNGSEFVEILYNYDDDVFDNKASLYCVQGCLKNNTQFRYAGLMKSKGGYKCYCGNNYNQTFAVDLNECLQEDNNACHECMKIYNTDYEMKPLLSIPGNGPSLVKIWNSSKKAFVNDVMRNPAIDLWNEKKLYHKPEYVKVLAMNRYGQNLWEMEFFTNNSLSANPCEWFRKENVLHQNKSSVSSISCNENKMAIKHGDKYYFVQKNVKEFGSIVTLAARNNTAQLIFQNVTSRCELSIFNYICDGNPNGYSQNQLRCYNSPEKYVTSFYHLSSEGSLTFPINPCNPSNQFKNCFHYPEACKEGEYYYNENSLESITACVKSQCFEFCPPRSNPDKCCSTTASCEQGQGRTYSALGVIEYKKESFAGRGEYICGIVLKCSGSERYCSIDITDVTTDLTITKFETRRSYITILLDTCVWASNITTNCSCQMFAYRQKDNVLAVVDRLVVLGFYHKEEPRVSKWEFLNDLPQEEVYNIMRPQLEKARHEGAVPVQNLSSRTRTKESAPDERTSSRGIGIMGGCLLGFIVLIIFISDLFIIKAHLTALFRNLYSLCRR
uniref:Uncharacterized protein LOC111135448 n=1 Tax=Crassostrea virginica TaxID=6565 RepID=A0A8B8EMW4_CRAVI|nr:uncharacterized protein LOC111135448 [Crassostrea virginica]